MVAVDQTRFGDEGPGGNCLVACVASIMDLSIGEMPEISTDDPYWWETLQKWLSDRRWKIRHRPRAADVPAGYAIANGPADRGLLHSCVALDGVIVHDPHPSRAGLIEVNSWFELSRWDC